MEDVGIYYILCPFGLFYGHLVYFMAIWYIFTVLLCWSILRPSGILYGHLVYFVVIWYIFPVLVCCSTKNLAAQLRSVLL
jgi:hypothetical protein